MRVGSRGAGAARGCNWESAGGAVCCKGCRGAAVGEVGRRKRGEKSGVEVNDGQQ